jgi:hypothetical protein
MAYGAVLFWYLPFGFIMVLRRWLTARLYYGIYLSVSLWFCAGGLRHGFALVDYLSVSLGFVPMAYGVVMIY